jgi:hypothetical protein
MSTDLQLHFQRATTLGARCSWDSASRASDGAQFDCESVVITSASASASASACRSPLLWICPGYPDPLDTPSIRCRRMHCRRAQSCETHLHSKERPLGCSSCTSSRLSLAAGASKRGVHLFLHLLLVLFAQGACGMALTPSCTDLCTEGAARWPVEIREQRWHQAARFLQTSRLCGCAAVLPAGSTRSIGPRKLTGHDGHRSDEVRRGYLAAQTRLARKHVVSGRCMWYESSATLVSLHGFGTSHSFSPSRAAGAFLAFVLLRIDQKLGKSCMPALSSTTAYVVSRRNSPLVAHHDKS